MEHWQLTGRCDHDHAMVVSKSRKPRNLTEVHQLEHARDDHDACSKYGIATSAYCNVCYTGYQEDRDDQ